MSNSQENSSHSDLIIEKQQTPYNKAGDIHRTVLLDPDGDIFLRCACHSEEGNHDFRVSANILRLASPVFKSMFSGCFLEGQRLLLEGVPVIELKDDDPELMGSILRILHYQGKITDHTMSAKSLARLAIQCDKYDLTRSLGLWTTTWLRNVRTNDTSAEVFGFKMLAAYIFGDSKEFRDISREAVFQLDLSFSSKWEKEELLSILPFSITGK